MSEMTKLELIGIGMRTDSPRKLKHAAQVRIPSLRGREVSCFAKVARSWLHDRLITGREYSRIVSCSFRRQRQPRSAVAVRLLQ